MRAEAVPEANIAVPIVFTRGMMLPLFPAPCVVLPPAAREVLRRKPAANDGKPADEPPAAA